MGQEGNSGNVCEDSVLASNIRVYRPSFAYSLRPPLKGGDSEESHHGCQNIVKVKLAVLPAAGLDDGVVNLPILVCDVVTPEKGRERVNSGSLSSPFTPDPPVTLGMLGGMRLVRLKPYSSSHWEELQWVNLLPVVSMGPGYPWVKVQLPLLSEKEWDVPPFTPSHPPPELTRLALLAHQPALTCILPPSAWSYLNRCTAFPGRQKNKGIGDVH